MPDNFQSNRSLSSAPTKTVEEPSLPKVLTVASASTHPAGGPLHGLHGHSDAHTHEVSSEEKPPAPPPSFGAAMNNVFSAPSRVWKASGSGLSGSLPEVGMSKSDRAEYKQPEKGLNDEEKRGLWVLGGIVGLGLLFGGPGRGKKEGMEGKEGKGRTAKHG